jgi:hypothetical protein
MVESNIGANGRSNGRITSICIAAAITAEYSAQREPRHQERHPKCGHYSFGDSGDQSVSLAAGYNREGLISADGLKKQAFELFQRALVQIAQSVMQSKGLASVK